MRRESSLADNIRHETPRADLLPNVFTMSFDITHLAEQNGISLTCYILAAAALAASAASEAASSAAHSSTGAVPAAHLAAVAASSAAHSSRGAVPAAHLAAVAASFPASVAAAATSEAASFASSTGDLCSELITGDALASLSPVDLTSPSAARSSTRFDASGPRN